FGNARQRVGICIDILKQVQKPALLVPGNNESLEELVSACASWPQAVVLHGEGADMMGRHFFGLGGGVPVTPFGAWSYDFTEEQATELLKPMPPGAILVSHSPPKGILDINSSGRSL